MNKTPDPGEVVRDKVIPAAEELVASVAERVGPLAHQAVDAVTPFAQHTREAAAPYAQQAADAVAPYAALLREQGSKTGHDLADRLEPALEAAKDAWSGARDRVTAEVIPAVGAAAATAAASASPLVTAATERGKALISGTRSDPVVVVPPPKKKRGWFRTLAVVAAAAGAAYVVVRKLVGDKGSQWQTARPTTPYASPVSAEAGVATPTPETHQPAESGGTEGVARTTALYGTVGSGDASATVDTDSAAIADEIGQLDAVVASDEGDDPSSAAGASSGPADHAAVNEDAASPYTDEHLEEELETVEERAYEEPDDAVWAEQDTAVGGGPAAHPERYDIAGAYVGVEPPEGFTIKGNERSMKYHLPDSNSYSRTIAEVWFASEEAAQQAGFTRAQH